jgi:hypothetical protein
MMNALLCQSGLIDRIKPSQQQLPAATDCSPDRTVLNLTGADYATRPNEPDDSTNRPCATTPEVQTFESLG